MGQKASKPPIRVVLPADETEDNNDGGEEEDEENYIDKLGVSAEESDYPEPKPPFLDTSIKEDHSVKGIASGKAEHTNAITTIEEEGTMFSTKSTPDEEFQVELVPVGASFQKSTKRRFEVNTELDSGDDTDKKSYPVVKTITRSLSLRDSLIGSGIATSSAFQLGMGMTKREAMLAERERHEYLNLMAPKAGAVTHKGQFRRFHYDSLAHDTHTATTDRFRNVEDRVADEIAEKHRDHRAETYESLTVDLIADINSERLKVKIILAWMSKQGIGRLQFGPKPPPPDTPNGYMMLIQEGQGTFPVLFALLCRAAKLKCAIISGISKGTHYEVGSKDTELLKNTWNAVYVEGSWQLVHPLWVCKGVANRQLGGWMKIEEEGKSKRKLSVATIGKDVPSFNPYFIFTKPEEFVYRNFPDEERWQLLQNPLTLDEFLEKTYIRPIFFMNSFKLVSEDRCVITSESGEPCEIKIKFPKQNTSDTVFGYDLSKKIDNETNDVNGMEEKKDDADETIQEAEKDQTDAKRFVMVKKSEGSVTFEIRCFKMGTYKLRLYGGYFKEFGNRPPWIIDVLMTCNNVAPEANPLPFDPGPVCWGPGPISESVGLYVPSHTESDIQVTDEEDTIVYFVLHHKVKVKASLHHHNVDSEKLREFIDIETVVIGDVITLQIRVMNPGEGEYGLQIHVRSHRMDVNACNYIVQTSLKRPFETYYPRRARRMVLDAMETCDIDFLKGALDECERTGLSDTDPDVTGASNRFEFLSCKTELYVALLVNRIDVSEHALYRTRKANLDILLAKDMMKVEEHLQKLLKLDEGGWTCDIPEIDRQSLVELSELRKPKLEVRLVITSMYMLLGIEEDNLKDWKKVRKFLRNQQSTLIEIARLEKYMMLNTTSDVTVSESVLDRVQEILANYTLDSIRRVDNTAAAYFSWVTSVTERLKDDQKQTEDIKSAKTTRSAKSTSSSVKSFRKKKVVSPKLSVIPEVPTASPVISDTSMSKLRSKSEKNSVDKKSMTMSLNSNRQSAVTKKNENSTRMSHYKDDISIDQRVPSNKHSATKTENSTRMSHYKDDISIDQRAPSNKTSATIARSEHTENTKSAISQQSRNLNDETNGSISKQSLERTRSVKTRNSTKEIDSMQTVNASKASLTMEGDSAKVNSRNKSQASVRSDLLSKRSETFVQHSQKSVDLTPVSRKGSTVTAKSIKSISVKNNGNVDTVTNGSIKDDISGKTFFSEGKGRQPYSGTGQTSRPGSKRQH